MGETCQSDYCPCLEGHEQNRFAFVKIGDGMDISVVKR